MVYTIAKKLNKDLEDGKAVPGSLEEDLATPEHFFQARHNSVAHSKVIPLLQTIPTW